MIQSKVLRVSLTELDAMKLEKIQHYLGFAMGQRELERKENQKANMRR